MKFRGKDFVLGIDKASQYILLNLIIDKTKSLEKFALSLGLPTILKNPCFKSKPFTDFTDKYGIQHVLTSAYNPALNGQAKRVIQKVKKIMEKMVNLNPYFMAFTLNKMEFQGNYGAPMDLFLNRPSRGVSPNSQKIVLDLVKNEEERRL